MLDEQVVSAVAIGNLKAISEQPAMLSNLAFANAVASTNLGQQNAVHHQRTVSELGLSVLARGTNSVSNLDPMTARSAVDVLTNNELAQTIADLKGTVEAFAGGPTGGGGGAGGGGGGAKGLWKLLKELVKLGLRLDAQGELVVPPSMAIRIPGRFQREDIKIVLDDAGVRIQVSGVKAG